MTERIYTCLKDYMLKLNKQGFVAYMIRAQGGGGGGAL